MAFLIIKDILSYSIKFAISSMDLRFLARMVLFFSMTQRDYYTYRLCRRNIQQRFEHRCPQKSPIMHVESPISAACRVRYATAMPMSPCAKYLQPHFSSTCGISLGHSSSQTAISTGALSANILPPIICTSFDNFFSLFSHLLQRQNAMAGCLHAEGASLAASRHFTMSSLSTVLLLYFLQLWRFSTSSLKSSMMIPPFKSPFFPHFPVLRYITPINIEEDRCQRRSEAYREKTCAVQSAQQPGCRDSDKKSGEKIICHTERCMPAAVEKNR